MRRLPRLRARRGRQRGFTLLEMMLTVGLIALTATFVGLNFNQSDARLVDLEAKRFVALVNLAQDESIITGTPIILNIDAGGRTYRFTPLMTSLPDLLGDTDTSGEGDGAAKRQPRQDDLFKERTLPESIQLAFALIPGEVDKQADSEFVPQKVHELLNKSLFDREEGAADLSSGPADESIVIEPDGLITPFTFSLASGDRTANIGLDRSGRAVLLASP